MTQEEYEQKKRECYEEYECPRHSINPAKDAFSYAFDRAYALGKQTEAITQEEIEKAAMGYILNRHKAKHNAKNDEEAFLSDFDNTLKAWDAFDMAQAYEDGANFALGKQNKNDNTVIQGWVAKDEVAIRPALYTSKPLRQKKGFKNGYWSYGMQIGLSLDPSLFPDLTWESDPEPVEIIIKRKKK